MSTNGGLGLSLMHSFIDETAFLHDDWNPKLGERDWDAYDTNPFLLGANTVVVSTMHGFGAAYEAKLAEIGLLSKNIIIPEKREGEFQTLTQRLISDKLSLAKLISKIESDTPNISTFYAYETDVLAKAISHLEPTIPAPKIIPSPADFNLADNKLDCRRILENANIPIPMGRVCHDASDLTFFLDRELPARFQKIIIKKGHRDSQILSRDQLEAIQLTSLGFPFVAEAKYDFVISPVSQAIRYRNQKAYLFTLAQKVDGLTFGGNTTLPYQYSFLEKPCRQLLERVHDEFPNHEGVFGVDFIWTSSEELLVVDVNPRFNSSTYPYYFIEKIRSGRNLTGEYGVVDSCSFEDLSGVAASIGEFLFCGRSQRGILPFNPVLDRQSLRLAKWSYVVVADGIEDVKHLKSKLMKAVGHHR